MLALEQHSPIVVLRSFEPTRCTIQLPLDEHSQKVALNSKAEHGNGVAHGPRPEQHTPVIPGVAQNRLFQALPAGLPLEGIGFWI